MKTRHALILLIAFLLSAIASAQVRSGIRINAALQGGVVSGLGWPRHINATEAYFRTEADFGGVLVGTDLHMSVGNIDNNTYHTGAGIHVGYLFGETLQIGPLSGAGCRFSTVDLCPDPPAARWTPYVSTGVAIRRWFPDGLAVTTCIEPAVSWTGGKPSCEVTINAGLALTIFEWK